MIVRARVRPPRLGYEGEMLQSILQGGARVEEWLNMGGSTSVALTLLNLTAYLVAPNALL